MCNVSRIWKIVVGIGTQSSQCSGFQIGVKYCIAVQQDMIGKQNVLMHLSWFVCCLWNYVCVFSPRKYRSEWCWFSAKPYVTERSCGLQCHTTKKSKSCRSLVCKFCLAFGLGHFHSISTMPPDRFFPDVDVLHFQTGRPSPQHIQPYIHVCHISISVVAQA